MSKTVYVYDGTPNGLVKIVEQNNGFAVYRLDEVEVGRKRMSDGFDQRCSPSIFNHNCSECKHVPGGKDCMLKLKFTFDKAPVKTWSYKPYEDGDVSDTPNQFYPDVKRMEIHKVSMR